MLTVTITKKNIRLYEHPKIWMPTQFATLFGKILDDYLEPDMNTLEIGIGSGVLAILAGLKKCKVTGFDINPDAPELCYKSWALNGLNRTDCMFKQGDKFTLLDDSQIASFDVIWSNAPTFPAEPKDKVYRESRDAYEWAGEDGREVLDAMITGSKKWLRAGGKMMTVATSKQSWKQTEQLMNQHWQAWRVISTVDLLLAAHYNPYIDLWLKQEDLDKEPRIFQQEGQWHQRLYFIEGQKTEGL